MKKKYVFVVEIKPEGFYRFNPLSVCKLAEHDAIHIKNVIAAESTDDKFRIAKYERVEK